MPSNPNDYFEGLAVLARVHPTLIRRLRPSEIAACWRAFLRKEAWVMDLFRPKNG